MPNIKSAIKKAKQDLTKKARNDSHRGMIESVVRKATKGLAEKKGEFLNKAYSIIDKASKKNVIHKNKASRLKRRVSNLIANNK